jgi:chromosome segregation ATPase
VDVLEDRLRRTEAELASRDEKVAELKKARQDLYQKLYEAEAAIHEQVGRADVMTSRYCTTSGPKAWGPTSLHDSAGMAV